MCQSNQNTIILSTVDSSNNYAIKLINSGKAAHGTVVLAYCQENGRGQGKNRWESAPAMNLLASIILFPGFLPVENQFYLSEITSLAIVDLLKEETGNVTIKWPNDIYAGEKKICGILIENMVQGNHIQSSVAGIGLNLNQTGFSDNLPNPVSLKLLTGKDYAIEDVLIALREKFFTWYDKLESGKTDKIDEKYHEYLFRRNMWTHFQTGNRAIEGCIVGIGEFGRLIVKDRSGNYSQYMHHEIDFR
jgi:BirA family transcriptional regulator, biotin operon repressor / biotin---[acetyl-CoA-carboxylase] ligase